MKDFLSCLAAMGWIAVIIYQMSQRRQLPRGCDIHGPGAGCLCLFKTQDYIELREAADRAHRGGWVHCPIHGPDCYRRREARRTGRSQTDEDLARDEDLRRKAAINGSH